MPCAATLITYRHNGAVRAVFTIYLSSELLCGALTGIQIGCHAQKEDYMDKEVKLYDFKITTKADDGMTFEGYASTFGNRDRGNDVVQRGAFVESLKTRMPKLLWQHDTRDVVGKIEEAYEDESGLYIKGRLINTTLGREAYEHLKEGTIDSMSIGYGVREFEDEGDVRYLKELVLYEVSLVTFPMNEQARVVAVKNALDNEREIEGFLREAGFTRSVAKVMAIEGVKAMRGQREAGADEVTITALKSLSDTLLKGASHV
jgi:HK97 family phage prohead protease